MKKLNEHYKDEFLKKLNTELNKSQKYLLDMLTKFVMLSYQEKRNLEKAKTKKTKLVKALK